MRDLSIPISSRSTRTALIFALISPLAVVGLGQLAARLIGPRIGVWSFVPLNLGYWATALMLVVLFGGKEALPRWIEPPQGRWWWPTLGLLVSTGPAIPMLIGAWQLFALPEVWIPTIVFVLINPLAEEFYWRGLVIDSGRAFGMRPWVIAIFSSLFFTLNHLWISVMSTSARNPMASIFQFVFGMVMSLVYIKTGSLRWTLLCHFLINLLTPTIAVFLNMYVP